MPRATPHFGWPTVSFEINRESPQARGIRAWWPFLDTRGTNLIRDTSGHGYSIAMPGGAGSPVWQNTAQRGSVLDFDGAAQYLNWGDVLDPGLSDWSWGGWFRADWVAPNQSRSLIAKSLAGNAASRWFTIFEGGNLFSHCEFAALALFSVTTAEGPYLDGQWHHVVTTVRRMGSMILYVDGIAVDNIDVSAQAAHNMDSAFLLLLGRYNDAVGGLGTLWFDGALNDWRVANVAWTAGEVWHMYAPETRWDLYKTPMVPRARSPFLPERGVYRGAWRGVLRGI